MNKKNKEKYNKFMNEQFRILKGHFERCMGRCHNELMRLEKSEDSEESL